MAVRPMLFTPEMADAAWRGVKTQTRRLLPHQPREIPSPHHKPIVHEGAALFRTIDGEAETVPLPFEYGDLLWVRETWRAGADWDQTKPSDLWAADPIWYEADGDCRERVAPVPGFVPGKRRPSIFMPRWASRMTLQVLEVRVQRLRDIERTDAIAEGVQPVHDPQEPRGLPGYLNYLDADDVFFGDSAPVLSFSTLWDKLNAPRDWDWDRNPWVAVATFRRLRVNINEKAAA